MRAMKLRGGPVPVNALAMLAGKWPSEVRLALAALRQRGLVIECDAGWDITNEGRTLLGRIDDE